MVSLEKGGHVDGPKNRKPDPNSKKHPFFCSEFWCEVYSLRDEIIHMNKIICLLFCFWMYTSFFWHMRRIWNSLTSHSDCLTESNSQNVKKSAVKQSNSQNTILTAFWPVKMTFWLILTSQNVKLTYWLILTFWLFRLTFWLFKLTFRLVNSTDWLVNMRFWLNWLFD